MAILDDVAAALSVPISRADLIAAFEAFIAGDWTGPAGADGADGAQGIQGEPGEDGADGVGAELPVGSVYMNVTDDTDPATLLGYGTWARLQGVFLVGHSDSDSDFGLGDTGGTKEETLTAAQSGVPAHNHGLQRFTSTSGGSSGFTADTSMSGGPSAVTLTTANSNAASAAEAHNNLPPFKAVAMWYRTA